MYSHTDDKHVQKHTQKNATHTHTHKHTHKHTHITAPWRRDRLLSSHKLRKKRPIRIHKWLCVSSPWQRDRNAPIWPGSPKSSHTQTHTSSSAQHSEHRCHVSARCQLQPRRFVDFGTRCLAQVYGGHSLAVVGVWQYRPVVSFDVPSGRLIWSWSL